MSEQTPIKFENEQVPVMHIERRQLSHAEHAKELREVEKDPQIAVREAEAKINETIQSDTQPNPMEKLETEQKAAQAVAPTRLSPEMLQINTRRLIARIQRQESKPQKVLSKVIHQPVIRAVSELAGKTVSRPSGLLGGGLVALLGTTSYLSLARHIGFTYNYGVFLVLFFGGFIVGVALELMVHMMTASRRHAD